MIVAGFLGFTLLVAVIAWLGTRHRHVSDTAEGYFLAGRSLGAVVIAGSLLLTNLSTEHLIGLNGDAFRHTIAVTAWETTAALAMVLTALVFLPRYLRMGLTTVPEFLATRFDEATRVIMSALFLLSYAVAILPVVLLFGATGLEALFEVSAAFSVTRQQSLWLLVWGVGTLGSLYAIFGGLRAVAISDTVNGIGFLIASVLIPVLALVAIGDGNVLGGLHLVYASETPKFDITGDEPGSFLPFSVLFTGMIVNQIFFWCVNQSILQRALGARSLAAGQQGMLLAAVFKLLGPLVVVLPGVIAWHLFQGEIAPENSLEAYPRLVREVLPPVLGGFFAAVMVGAVLSTFNSVLNSAATLFSTGVYQPLFNRAATDGRIVKVGRGCSIVLALAAMLTAPRIDTSGSLYNYLQQINATFFGPMLAVILAALFTRRASAPAAKAALVVGPVVFYLVNFVYREPLQSAAQSLLGVTEPIHFLHWLAVVFLFTVVLIALISWAWPDRRPMPGVTVPATAPVDLTPWRLAKPVSALIVLATLACYILLHQ